MRKCGSTSVNGVDGGEVPHDLDDAARHDGDGHLSLKGGPTVLSNSSQVIEKNGAGGRTRTCTPLREGDFKSPASTIPPLRLGADSTVLSGARQPTRWLPKTPRGRMRVHLGIPCDTISPGAAVLTEVHTFGLRGSRGDSLRRFRQASIRHFRNGSWHDAPGRRLLGAITLDVRCAWPPRRRRP